MARQRKLSPERKAFINRLGRGYVFSCSTIQSMICYRVANTSILTNYFKILFADMVHEI